MTLSKSLFNYGIYKNTIKRFIWGSFLYFVILFFSLPFIFLTQSPSHLYADYMNILDECPLILTNSFIIVPLLAAIAVPTVTAALAFNNIHSARQAVFVHSLPLTRKANYVSTLCACLTLMAAPVLLTALILFAMSITVYGNTISTLSVVYWLALNLSVIFIMFSVSTFSAMLTGSTAAHIVINIFIHLIPVILALAIYLVCDTFLFGFDKNSDYFIVNKLIISNPVVWLYERAVSYQYRRVNVFATPDMWIYIVGAAVFYLLAYRLYARRKIESCGDIAAFGIFRPILKYSLTAGIAVAVFGVLSSAELGPVPVFTVATVFTLIAYFAAEMLMNKIFRVFGAYKGYAAFWIICGICISFFAFTDVFGFEMRIPKPENIESATVYSGYKEPYIEGENEINAVTAIHKSITEARTVTVNPDEYYNLDVSYKLKNGKTLDRSYAVSKDVYNDAMETMYGFEDYKLKTTGILDINIDNVQNLELTLNAPNLNHVITVNDKSPELLHALKKDIAKMSYSEMNNRNSVATIYLSVGVTKAENDKYHILPDDRFKSGSITYKIEAFTFTINENCTNTIDFLRANGYFDEFVSQLSQRLYICPIPVIYDSDTNKIAYKNDTGDFYNFITKADDLVKLSDADAVTVAENFIPREAFDNDYNGLHDGKNYLLFLISPSGKHDTVRLSSMCVSYPADAVPSVLKYYIAEK